jgi:hypothetical protein
LACFGNPRFRLRRIRFGAAQGGTEVLAESPGRQHRGGKGGNERHRNHVK